MRVGIVGVGLIGVERIKSLQKINKKASIDVVGFFDSSETVSHKVSAQMSLKSFSSLGSLLKEQLDWVFISVPHDITVSAAIAAIESGANILVEKPLGRSIKEAEFIIAKANKFKKIVNVGMNYRYFLGVASLIADVNNNKFGEIISIKLTLAHGNSPGMEKSWKLSKDRCGGGCLIDPGIHVFDLINCLLPGEKEVLAVADWKGFWNTGIEEEVHLILKSSTGAIINSDISLNRWRSEFSIQVNGKVGYGRVSGRGKSYGNQEYVVGERWAWLKEGGGGSQAETEKAIVSNYNADDSFFWETVATLGLMSFFKHDSCLHYIKPATVHDALLSMRIMSACQNFIE
jgi:predicted dehydrogenase